VVPAEVAAVVVQVWVVMRVVAVVPVRLAAAEGDDNKSRDKGSSDDNNHRNSMDMDNNNMDSTGMCNNMDGVADGIAYQLLYLEKK
jgi:hypothetical protein